jgi:hypothetical protein
MTNASKNIIRKTARLSGLFIIVVIITLAFLELVDNWGKQTQPLSKYLIILFSVLCAGVAGLILSFRKEFWGGLISLLCFIAFNILAAKNPLPGARYPFFLIVTIVPSILYLLWWWLQKKSANKK